MATLPVDGPFVPGSIGLPIASVDDVRAVFPASARGNNEAAPIREALAAGITATQQAHQGQADYAAAQSDVTRSTGIYLDGQLGDRGQVRQPAEEDDDYRDRGLSVPKIVTPNAILAAVNKVLSAYTTISAQIIHSILDRWFVGGGGRPYAFITKARAVDPEYADRYYPERNGFRPGGAWAFKDTAPGRLFVVRIPVIAGIGGTFVLSGLTDESAEGAQTGSFIGDGSSSTVSSFTSSGAEPALDIYQAIANAVAGIKGHGVRVVVYADPLLVA